MNHHHHHHHNNNSLNSANSIQSRSGLNTITSSHDYDAISKQSSQYNAAINHPNYQRQVFPHPIQNHPSQQSPYLHYPQVNIHPHHHNAHNGQQLRSQNASQASNSSSGRQIKPALRQGLSVKVCYRNYFYID